MNRNTQVRLFRYEQDHHTEEPAQKIKLKFARELVAQGVAEWSGRDLKMSPSREVATSCELIWGDKQGFTIESAAIDKNPRFFQGGLTRDEHKPAKFQLFKGARVGHQ